MAKGTVAKGKKGPSVHSRAARRATSPGIDTDKSLKDVRLPDDSRSVATYGNSGVSKKKRKVAMSRKARERLEKSMDRAEAVMDRTATKVERSKGHYKVIKSRKRTWDEVNKDVDGEILPPKKKEGASKDPSGDAAVAEFYGDGDEDMEEVEDAAAPHVQPARFLPAADDNDDEIL